MKTYHSKITFVICFSLLWLCSFFELSNVNAQADSDGDSRNTPEAVGGEYKLPENTSA